MDVDEIVRLNRRIDNIGCISFPGFENFEAWTQCPSCDRIEVHRMRWPKVDEPVEYDTIRRCVCGQEWGQR